MKLFRITYRVEVFIQAKTERQAQEIFEGADLGGDYADPGAPGVAGPEEFVETVSLEEYPADFLD
jgi:hypothetical protein